MIPIYSSYYAKVRSLDVTDAMLVQVSNTKPQWFQQEILNVANLTAPDWNLINRYKSGEISFEQFGERYIQSLNQKMKRDEFVSKLTEVAEENNYKTIILLCYEKSLNECHRKFLGEWLQDAYLYEL